jgi:hypothetical protein
MLLDIENLGLDGGDRISRLLSLDDGAQGHPPDGAPDIGSIGKEPLEPTIAICEAVNHPSAFLCSAA